MESRAPATLTGKAGWHREPPGTLAIEFDADAHYLTASSRAFGFVEEVKPEDREWAKMLGGVPLSEIAVDHVLLTAVKEASD